MGYKSMKLLPKMPENLEQYYAQFFRVLWIMNLLLLFAYTWDYTSDWNSETSFITSEFFAFWFLIAATLGLLASYLSWWQAIQERKPEPVRLVWVKIIWFISYNIYIGIVVAFYIGLFIGLLFALDSTFHRYESLFFSQPEFTGPDLRRWSLIPFGIVAVFQTTVIGTGMAKSFMKLIDYLSELRRDDQRHG